MSEPTEADLVRAREAAHIISVLPYIRREIEQMEKALENRMVSENLGGNLTPEMAKMAWQEKIVYRNLLKRFENKAAGNPK